MRRAALAGPAGLLQARVRSAVPPPRLVPLPAHVQGHQGGAPFVCVIMFVVVLRRFLFDLAHPHHFWYCLMIALFVCLCPASTAISGQVFG